MAISPRDLFIAPALSVFFATVAPAQVLRSEGKPPESLRQKLAEPQLAVDVSPDGRRVVCSGQNRAITQWTIDGIELPALKNAPGGWCVCYSPDGKLIAGCGLDRMIRLWDAETGQEVRQLQGHVQIAWMAAFMPGGDRLVSVGEDATIRFWSVADGQEIGQFLGHPGPVWCMALSPDGAWLATGGADGTMRLWDVAGGRPRRVLEGHHGGGVGALCFSPDGRTLASTGWQDQKLFLWEVATGRCRRPVPHDGGSKFVTFMPDGRTLITAGNDRTIRFWDLADGTQGPPLEGHVGAVNGLALRQGGRGLVSVSNDNTVRSWDLTGRRQAGKPALLPARRVEACWAALGRADGRGAYDAIASLAVSPEQAIALFRERLRPAASPNGQRIAALIGDTAHGQYAVRQQATADLERLGEEAEAPLRQALLTTTSPETRRRAERVLQRMEAGGMSTEMLRGLRSVEVLERIGTAEARAMLESLAAGTPEARLTVEARSSLRRLNAKEGLTLR